MPPVLESSEASPPLPAAAPPPLDLTANTTSPDPSTASNTTLSGVAPAGSCPESPSSGAFPAACAPVGNAGAGSYSSQYSPGQLGVIGFVSCAAVLVAVGGFAWWLWKYRRGRGARVVSVVGAGAGGTNSGGGAAGGGAQVPQTVRIPRSAFARRQKRVHLRAEASEHELTPARNPDGTLRDPYDEEGLDTVATFETGETLVTEASYKPPAEEGEGKEGVELGVMGKEAGEAGEGDGMHEVPLAIQRLTLGPLPQVTVSPPSTPALPSPAYHPHPASDQAYWPVPPTSPSQPGTPTAERDPPSR